MPSNNVDVAVVGAGAAGLAAAAELRRHRADAIVLEREAAVASSWRTRYDGLRLNTVSWQSGLRGARIPRSAGRWPRRDDFVAYLEDFAERSGVPIRLGTAVSRIAPAGDGWLLETSKGPLAARFVVVATGYDRVPTIPWPPSDFSGELLHTSEYRNAERFRDKDVLVVGAGNSATEIATQLATRPAGRVRLSIRTPVNIVPRELGGLPIPPLARLLERLPDRVGNGVGLLTQRAAFGDLSPYGMPRAPHGISTELRLKGLGPVVDRGFVAALKQRRIETVAAVERLDGNAVVLADDRRITPDVVIAGTGYRHGLEDLVGHLGVLLPSGRPAVVDGGAHPAAPRLYFNGFWLPLSGQLPAMRRTTRRIVRVITQQASTVHQERSHVA